VVGDLLSVRLSRARPGAGSQIWSNCKEAFSINDKEEMRSRWCSFLAFGISVICISLLNFSDAIDNDHEALEEFRLDGYCTALCTRGHSIDGYGTMLELFKQVDDPIAFDTFLDSYYDDEEEKHGLEDIDLVRRNHLKFRASCNKVGFNFEDCIMLEKLALEAKATFHCVFNCMHDLLENDPGFCPSIEMMALPHRELLNCILEFDQETVTIDAQKSIDPDEALSILQKYGFVAFKNFFSAGRMEEIHEILLDWRRIGEWDTRQYADFMAKRHLHGSALREEVVVPYTIPFLSILKDIEDSFAWQVMDRYVGLPGLQLEFVTSILSDPGAGTQLLHTDVAVPGRKLKGNLALHRMKKENGPTGFCPCSHSRAPFYYSYAFSPIECLLHFQPDFVDSGTFVIYDQALQHQGMDNRGNDTRFILDISYLVGMVDEDYIENFAPIAREEVMKFRNGFQK
jgi:Phytanoyl-CoA dioxygenase (PhyH)